MILSGKEIAQAIKIKLSASIKELTHNYKVPPKLAIL